MMSSAAHVLSGLSAAASVSRSSRSVSVGAAREHAVELLEEHLVRERHRVGLREARQQAALVPLVVEKHDLVVVAVVELASLRAVAHRDRRRELARHNARAVERHTTLHERAEHREETAPRARDR